MASYKTPVLSSIPSSKAADGCLVVVAEDTAADAPNHRAMPPHEDCQSRLITAADEVFQQLTIGQTRSLLEKDRPAQVLDDPAYSAGRHLDFLAKSTPL